jgi:hypothetical protein
MYIRVILLSHMYYYKYWWRPHPFNNILEPPGYRLHQALNSTHCSKSKKVALKKDRQIHNFHGRTVKLGTKQYKSHSTQNTHTSSLQLKQGDAIQYLVNHWYCIAKWMEKHE